MKHIALDIDGIEEILDMPVINDEICEQNNGSDNKSHDNSNHGMFCVTGNDIEELY